MALELRKHTDLGEAPPSARAVQIGGPHPRKREVEPRVYGIHPLERPRLSLHGGGELRQQVEQLRRAEAAEIACHRRIGRAQVPGRLGDVHERPALNGAPVTLLALR